MANGAGLEEVTMNLLDYYRAGMRRLIAKRNETDTRRQAVRVSNKELRKAQARRIMRQPGLTPEQRELAIKRLGVRS